MKHPQIVCSWSVGNTLEDERREVFESVMGALSSGMPDPDEMAACSYLLHHLSHEAESRVA